MRQFNAAAIALAMSAVTVSQEDNDLNININADHEGDAAPTADDFATTPVVEPVVAEPVVEPVVVEDAIAADTSETPETAELDVADAAGDVVESANKVDDTNAVAVGIESVLLQLATISNEGIDVTPFIANSLRVQLDHATRKFPKAGRDENGESIVASVESWTVSQEENTSSMIGKAVTKLKGAGAAIVKFLKELWERIKSLTGSTKATAGLIKRKAESLQGKKANGKEIKLPGQIAGIDSASLKQLAQLVTAVGNAKLNAGTLVEKGWGAATAQTSLAGSYKAGTYLGGFIVAYGENKMPTVTTAEVGEGKHVTLKDGEVAAILAGTLEIAKALEAYAAGEVFRKKVTDALIAACSAEVTPEDAGRYAKWKLARETATHWGKYSAFEAQVVKRAIGVANAANNAVATSVK